MVDFPVCPSSERIALYLIPFRRFSLRIGSFHCTIPQSLRDSSLYTREPLPRPIFHPLTKQPAKFQLVVLLS